ncbi:MAG: GNAT family N-acetyltransferase [Hyphomicrobiaceae bacterium]|nr:GNAT family N-acetyltransferase [Hyphomicrobiaceae bacterium]
MNPRRAGAADLDAVVALQHAAYAKNRPILGVEPLPLQVDYADILGRMEVWLAEPDGRLDGVLILEPRPDDLLIWSVATDPALPPSGVGRALIAWAETRAREIGRDVMRLYTGTLLTDRIAWYARHGYATERVEVLPDRSVTHMVKRLPA